MTLTEPTSRDIAVTAPAVQGLPLFARFTSLDSLLNLRLLP
ncbi:hypothetical protein [Thiohalophilus thiocyanatoxydans]|uniref:Uncharacterized protein n=1 Tax=Thiohalophilus thiocyanatoxydans TaxID=381308 RepID=A0A4V3H429_9GAMM|nr:hypothetical protein [Thiohalophilus thiocyanatoxydans]TDY01625.1 hypothetical protein EDC23_1514 [Thiohalophilus thiocyanatoxydans]